MPKVSIIVPVFNRERSILFCLESINALHFRNFEVIVIDDGSSDRTPQICKEFCNTHNQFYYIYQDNGGVSKARNHGISLAKGEWITFIDSDDAICPDHLDVIDLEKDNDIDWIIESFQLIGTVKGNIQIQPILKEYFNTRIESNEPIKYYITSITLPQNVMFSTCAKFFKHSICNQNNIRFNESISLEEDILFITTYVKHIKKLVHYPKVTTYLLQDWGDIHLSGKRHTPEDYMKVINSNYNAFLIIKDNTKECTIAIENYVLTRTMHFIIFQYTRRNNIHNFGRHNLNKFINKEIYPYYNNFKYSVSSVTFHYRFAYNLIRHRYIKTAIYFCQLYNLYNSIILRLKKIKNATIK